MLGRTTAAAMQLADIGWGLHQTSSGITSGLCTGDMVVEYVGEIVRRSVVSLREAAEYDARCGSGTYVFGMSASSGLCTDATRVSS